MLRREYSRRNSQYICLWCAGGWFNIKTTSYQYRKSHCGDKTILRPSYLHNGVSYTGKMTSLYWIRALVLCGANASASMVLTVWDKYPFHWVVPVCVHNMLDKPRSWERRYAFYDLSYMIINCDYSKYVTKWHTIHTKPWHIIVETLTTDGQYLMLIWSKKYDFAFVQKYFRESNRVFEK